MKTKELIKNFISDKRVKRALWWLCFLLFIIVFSQVIKYKDSKEYYNQGVEYFKGGYYEEAEDYFQYAMWEKHTKGMECKIRINKALSITTPITPESVTPENLNEKISRLEEARDYLTVNDCAHANDSNGHNKKAQKLKEEIDEYIEFLKNQNQKEEEKKEDKPDPSEDDEEKKKQEEEEKKRQQEEQEKLKKQFESIQEQGMKERNDNLALYGTWLEDDYLGYSGKSW